MRRRVLVAALLVAGLLGFGAAGGGAAIIASPLATSVPANALLFDSNRTGNYELWQMRTDGAGPAQLTRDARYDSWWPQLSPDRTKIVFYRTPAGTHDRDFTKTELWGVNVDGTNLRRLIAAGGYGWAQQGHAEWSPDGTKLVMFGGNATNPQIFVTDANGASPRRLTKVDRPGANLDPSWMPDGQSILFVGCPEMVCLEVQYEVYRINLDGTGERRLTDDLRRDHDPQASPNGATIAWLSQTAPPASWGIFTMPATGGTPRPVIDDFAWNSKPSWSLDSSTIYFHRAPLGRTLFNVFAVSPNGSGLRELEKRPPLGLGAYDNEFPTN